MTEYTEAEIAAREAVLKLVLGTDDVYIDGSWDKTLALEEVLEALMAESRAAGERGITRTTLIGAKGEKAHD